MATSYRFAAVTVWVSFALAVAAAAPRVAAGQSRDQFDVSAPNVTAPRTITYGADKMQSVDYWSPTVPASKVRPPLIVFVHGGAWSRGNKTNGTGRWKEAHYPGLGYAFATLDYRLVPTVRIEDQASDIANALRALINQSETLGFDPHRVVLMGHSAGAHLVALVSTDPAYLTKAKLSFADIAGTVAIDGAGYDVAEQIDADKFFLRREYIQAFGTDTARQRALSPTFQAGSPNVDHFLLLHVERPDSARQTDELAIALRRGGSQVQVNGFEGKGLAGHMTINRRLGDPTYSATPIVDAWLEKLFSH